MATEFGVGEMAQKDRISVDISDIKEQIESFRKDPAWRELSLASKVRVLVIEKLEEKPSKSPQNTNTK